MAHLHFKRTVYKSGGGKARARLEYITRQPMHELSRAEQQLRYVGGEREDLIFVQHRNLPEWASDNPHSYFAAAEKYERVGGVAFEEWKITLPHELSHRQNMDLMHDLVDAIAGETLPISYAFHDPPTLRDTRQQPHLHLLISARQKDVYDRTPAQHFKRFNRDHPARGGAQKADAFRHFGAIKAHRVLIADVLNLHLERAGRAERIHPDRLEARGIDRTPEPKLLPSESRNYREQGSISETMQQVLAIRASRVRQMAMEQNNARHYWEARKATLGLTRDMTREAQRQIITRARVHAMTQKPERPDLAELRTKEQKLTRRIQLLEGRVAHLQQAITDEHDLDRRWDRPLLGNTQSKIYHTPEHKNYGDVTPGHQVWFWSEREAQDAGYRRAQNDHYGRGAGQAMAERERGAGQAMAERERASRSPQDARRPQQGQHNPTSRLPELDLTTQEPEQGHGSAVRTRVFDRDREGRGYER